MSHAIVIRPPKKRSFFGSGFAEKVHHEMKSIHDEIERAAFELFQQRGSKGGASLEDWLRAEASVLKPVAFSIKEENDHLTVIADVPGFSMDELKIRVEGQRLHICGRSGKSGTSERRSEGRTSAVVRKIRCNIALPAAVKSDEASATLDKGVLTLLLPKAQPVKEIESKS